MNDVEFYIFSKWVLHEWLSEKKEQQSANRMTSFKRHVLPLLIHTQNCRDPKWKGSSEESNFEDFVEGVKSPKLETGSLHSKESAPARNLGCYALVLSSSKQLGQPKQQNQTEKPFLARCLSIPTYLQLNYEIANGSAPFRPFEPENNKSFIAPSSSVVNAMVGPGCVIGENVVLGEGTSIKKSIIGPNTKIGAQAKIQNSVIMANVTIGNGCVITSSIICYNAVIQEKSTLRDCQVSVNCKIDSNSVLEKQKIIF